MGKFIDLTGQRFGRLVAVSAIPGHGRRGGKVVDRKWNCLCDCGKTTALSTESLRSGNTKSCGCLKVYKAAESRAKPTCQRSIWKTKQGYLRIKKLGGGSVFHHRFVFEQYHGVKLQPWEHIHHKNGIRTDNRIENLELITVSKHFAGQRPADIIKATTETERQNLLKMAIHYAAAAGVDLSHLSQ